MPLFYFNIKIGNEPRSFDEEGEHHADIDRARAEACRSLCNLVGNGDFGSIITSVHVWIRDDSGDVMMIKQEYRIMRLH